MASSVELLFLQWRYSSYRGTSLLFLQYSYSSTVKLILEWLINYYTIVGNFSRATLPAVDLPLVGLLILPVELILKCSFNCCTVLSHFNGLKAGIHTNNVPSPSEALARTPGLLVRCTNHWATNAGLLWARKVAYWLLPTLKPCNVGPSESNQKCSNYVYAMVRISVKCIAIHTLEASMNVIHREVLYLISYRLFSCTLPWKLNLVMDIFT